MKFNKEIQQNFNTISNIILLLILIFGAVGYSVGFHFPNEILPGQFANGNYSFNGSLGIGTSNPSETLDINGTIKQGTIFSGNILMSGSDNVWQDIYDFSSVPEGYGYSYSITYFDSINYGQFGIIYKKNNQVILGQIYNSALSNLQINGTKLQYSENSGGSASFTLSVQIHKGISLN